MIVVKKDGSRVLCILRGIFVFITGIWILSGCATEYNLATGREEVLLYGTEKEISIGDSLAKKIKAKYKFVTDAKINTRLDNILKRLVNVCDRKDLVYSVHLIDDDIVNAVSLPGGYIYIFKGLADKLNSDDEFAAVIAHELGHITARHGIKRLQSAYGALLVQILAGQAGPDVARGITLALNSIFSKYSKQEEFEADRLSVKYVKKAGYNPEAIIKVLKMLQEEQRRSPARVYSYWRTHPYITKRIAVVNIEITGKVGFKDYLNLTE